MRALGSAQGALDALAALLPDEAERLTESGTETVRVSELRSGDAILVRSGVRMPADGTVVEGQAEFDESMITGESRTVLRSRGDPVVAGTIATDNSLRVRVTAIGEDTALAGIQRLVAEPRRPPRGPRPSPTAPPPSCSTSPPARASSPLLSGHCWAACPTPWSATLRCWSSRSPRSGHPGRRADQEPDGARADADGRRRAGRQDRDPDQGRAGAQGPGRRRGDRPGRAARAGRCGGVGQRAPPWPARSWRPPAGAGSRSHKRAVSRP